MSSHFARTYSPLQLYCNRLKENIPVTDSHMLIRRSLGSMIFPHARLGPPHGTKGPFAQLLQVSAIARGIWRQKFWPLWAQVKVPSHMIECVWQVLFTCLIRCAERLDIPSGAFGEPPNTDVILLMKVDFPHPASFLHNWCEIANKYSKNLSGCIWWDQAQHYASSLHDRRWLHASEHAEWYWAKELWHNL